METKPVINFVKKELIYLLYAFLAILILLTTIYYKEPLFNILKLSFNLFLLFFVTGYFILLSLRDKFEFTERLIAGTMLSFGISGILSYLLSLIGINLKYHGYINFTLIIIIGIIILQLQELKKQ